MWMEFTLATLWSMNGHVRVTSFTTYIVSHLTQEETIKSHCVSSLVKHNYSVRIVWAPAGAAAYHAKVEKLGIILANTPPHQVVMYMDLFDTFARHSSHTTLRRYMDHYWPRTVFSTELTPNHLDQNATRYYERASPRFANNKYINTGAFIGLSGRLSTLLKSASSHPRLHNGAKLRTDQTAIGLTIARDMADTSEVTLDYDERLFFTAANHYWSLARSTAHVRAVDPVIVHVPFTQAPRILQTYNAHVDAANGKPWAEANITFCLETERVCAKNHSAAFCHIGPGHRPGLNRVVC
jgi:hypothetical protein